VKKILYITLESLENDPIIHSQVIPVLQSMSTKFKIDLVTLENKDYFTNNNNLNKIIIIRKSSLPTVFWKLFKLLIIKGRNYDLIHVRSYSPMFAAIIAKIFNKKPIIFDMRGVMAHEFFMRFHANSSLGKKIKYLIFFLIFWIAEFFFIQFSNSIVVVSNNFLRYVSRRLWSKKNISVIPTFTSTQKTELHPKFLPIQEYTNNILFVYSGSIDVWQQLPQTLLAFQAIKNQIPASKLLILTRQVKEASLIAKEILPENCFFVESANSDQVHAVLSKCDYGFLLRKKNIVNQVAAPIKFAEYLSAGLKIILTDSIGDASAQTSEFNLGYILSDLTSNSINGFIQYHNKYYVKGKRGQLTENAKFLLYNHYCLENSITQYEKLYNTLI
jgi:glycosyltransferase involved in cell wall biosynthesis